MESNVTEVVIGSAMAVLNGLRPGLDEKLYERALVVELAHRGMATESQRAFEVRYRDALIGKLAPDLIVGGSVVVDAKVVTSFHDSHVAQMLGYLNITEMDVGLLLNFKYAKLQIKRVAR